MNARERTALAESVEYSASGTRAPAEKIAEWQAVLGDAIEQSEARTSGQLHVELRRDLLDAALRALASKEPSVAAQLVCTYEVLMRAGM